MSWIFDDPLRTVMAGSALLGIVAGALGCFAVLKRQSLLGDALAHAALPGVCLAFMAGTALGFDAKHPMLLLGGALATAWIGTLLILAITSTTRPARGAGAGRNSPARPSSSPPRRMRSPPSVRSPASCSPRLRCWPGLGFR